MTKEDFNKKWDNLMIFGTCGSSLYFFLNENKEIHVECKFCKEAEFIEVDRLIKFANDLKKFNSKDNAVVNEIIEGIKKGGI